MKILRYSKDGGPESTVSGLFFVEIKKWFSIALLRFENGSRDAYHEHAFNSVSWVLTGELEEVVKCPCGSETCMKRWRYLPSFEPVITKRHTFHKVTSKGITLVLTFRGPWVDSWREWTKADGYKTLTHGRKEVA